jgi:transposase
MRQTHGAGEKLFVDYAGDTVPVVIDRLTGKTRAAHLFVAVLGASSLSYAEARWSETLADWLECHVHALEAIGGVPALLVPDNAKVAVIKACLYDPQVNRSYAEMAAHYGSAVLPARPRRPRDKAKVEAAVRIVERWLLGRLRHRVFYGLAEVNAAIGELLTELNDRRVLRSVGRTRRQLFEEIDQPALKPLPVERYVYAEWRIRRAGLDYHVEIDRHYYSVPWRFAREQVEARITATTVELFRRGERIAAHRRSSGNGKHSTVPEHMPSAHRRFADWTIERISREASAIGSDAALLVEKILAERPHPEQGFRACLDIIRLAKGFGRERVNAACARALEIGARTYGSVRSILDNRLDQASAPRTASAKPIDHPNIRGPRYYH